MGRVGWCRSTETSPGPTSSLGLGVPGSVVSECLPRAHSSPPGHSQQHNRIRHDTVLMFVGMERKTTSSRSCPRRARRALDWPPHSCSSPGESPWAHVRSDQQDLVIDEARADDCPADGAFDSVPVDVDSCADVKENPLRRKTLHMPRTGWRNADHRSLLVRGDGRDSRDHSVPAQQRPARPARLPDRWRAVARGPAAVRWGFPGPNGLPFTYPPFAAVLFSWVALLPWGS